MNPLKKILLMSTFSATLSTACAGNTAWQDYARGAQLLGPTQVDSAAKALDALPAAQREATERLLGELMALTPGTAAIREAGTRITAAMPSLVVSSGSGPGPTGPNPGLSAALQAIDCVLHGLVYRSGQAVAAGPDKEAEAVAFLTALREGLKVYPRGSTPERMAPDWAEREARLGLGPELYLSAARTLAGKP